MSTSPAPAAPSTVRPRSTPLGSSGAGAGAGMAIGSMVCVQLGVAASVQLFGALGAEGTSALRLVWAGIVLLVVVRPRPSHFTRASFGWCLILGVVTAGMTLLFMGAVARLPLGTAAALEFLGPLAVALARSRGAGRWWAVLAGAGVVLLTEPWRPAAGSAATSDAVGIGLAIGAAACWAAYILLTQHVGDGVSGLRPLSVTMPVAGLVATATALTVNGSHLLAHLTWPLAVTGLGLALLLPVVPFSLELLALRRMSSASFGVLMSLEPAIALVMGLLALHQVPQATSLAGVALVVVAGIGAERGAGRTAA